MDAALVLVSVADAFSKGVDWGWPTAMWLSAAAVLGVVLRRRWPLPALLLSLPAMFWSAQQVAPGILLANYTYRRRRFVLPTIVAIVVVLTAANTITFWYTGPGWFMVNLQAAIYFAGFVGGAGLLGHLRRVRGGQRRQLEELRESRRREQLLSERAARTDERALLAREMHDVVSHQISLIALQAGALRVSDDAGDLGRVRATAEVIRHLAVQANDELRQVLGALTSDEVAAALDADHTIHDIARLWEAADVPGELDLPTPRAVRDVPAPVQRAVYRIVQEALTNVRKHAGGSRVTVRVAVRTPSPRNRPGIDLRVSNATGSGSPRPGGWCGLPTGGAGLPGIAERARALGGWLQAGPTTDGGFVVRAHLPTPDSRASG